MDTLRDYRSHGVQLLTYHFVPYNSVYNGLATSQL